MKNLILLILLFTVSVVSAQRIYVTNNRNEADYICYITNNKNEAHWVVKKTTWDTTASVAGNWKFIHSRNSADIIIYYTRNKSEADRIVYFTQWTTEIKF